MAGNMGLNDMLEAMVQNSMNANKENQLPGEGGANLEASLVQVEKQSRLVFSGQVGLRR